MEVDVIVKPNHRLGDGYVLATPVSDRAKDYMGHMFARSCYDDGSHPFLAKSFDEPFTDLKGNVFVIERQDALPANT